VSAAEIQSLVIGALQGVVSSTLFVLILFIGFCVLIGFTKLKKTAGNASVVKSLDECVSHQPMHYLPPNAPWGPADQLRAPELLEKAG
jgi:hypothetical protein